MKAFTVLCIVAFAVSALALSDHHKQKAREIGINCMKESKATLEEVNNSKIGIYSDTEELNKFAYCFLKGSNIISEDVELQEDSIREKLAGDLGNELETLISTCKHPAGATKEIKASNAYKCYYSHATKKVVAD